MFYDTVKKIAQLVSVT